jgi:hypothetical protein
MPMTVSWLRIVGCSRCCVVPRLTVRFMVSPLKTRGISWGRSPATAQLCQPRLKLLDSWMQVVFCVCVCRGQGRGRKSAG